MRIVFLVFSLFAVTVVQASNEKLEQLFAPLPIDGSMVITNFDGSKQYTYNLERAEQAFTVASTFKIPNTLIALEAGLVDLESFEFKWDGKPRSYKRWNQDQSLRSAFQYSCVWCYQEIAEKVGKQAYIKHLKALDYGTLPDQFELSKFWLDGSLKINSFEQIELLKGLHGKRFAYAENSYRDLLSVMLARQTDHYSMYAKTGWVPDGDLPVGWYVGYIQDTNDTWFFATNLALKEREHLQLRKSVTMAALRELKIITD